MARPHPHPQALFSLIPLNDRAKIVVAQASNSHLVSTRVDGRSSLDIGHTRSTSSQVNTLATLGRGAHSDVRIDGSSIAKTQCSFEIDPVTRVVMFCDKSFGQTSQVHGQDATPFEHHRLPRRIVVQPRLNTIIGMGGERRDLVQFRLKWYDDADDKVEKRHSAVLEENPAIARTVDEADTELPSRMETRIHTAGPREEIRYKKGESLGEGAFGKVYRAVNVDTGRLIAVKILKRPEAPSGPWDAQLSATKREVEILSQLSHPHIVEYLGSQAWDGPAPEIFMGLKEGSLFSLINRDLFTQECANATLRQMLQATDFLQVNDILHRDIKPENILYVNRDGGYHFQLANFGQCNHGVRAVTNNTGTPLFIAPEVIYGTKQTHKVDVWSLFVTMIWGLDSMGFRHASTRFDSIAEVQAEVLRVANESADIAKIREMARIDPDMRASAAQILVKIYGPDGFSTPLNNVPPISGAPRPGPPLPVSRAQAAPTHAVPGPSRISARRTPGSDLRRLLRARRTPAGRGRLGQPATLLRERRRNRIVTPPSQRRPGRPFAPVSKRPSLRSPDAEPTRTETRRLPGAFPPETDDSSA